MLRRSCLESLSRSALRCAAAVLVVLLLAAPPALAQNTDSATSPTPVPDLGLRPGQIVHVAAPSVGQLEARLVRAAGPELVLGAEGGERTVRLGAGDSLWVLTHSARQGAKVGGVVGLVLTGAAVALFYSICRDGTDDPCTGEAGFVPVGLVLSGTGALLGGAVGRLVQRWELRWP